MMADAPKYNFDSDNDGNENKKVPKKLTDDNKHEFLEYLNSLA